MSLSRNILLAEVARLEKCIGEKRLFRKNLEERKENATVEILSIDSGISEMSERVRKLHSEIDRMADDRPLVTAFNFKWNDGTGGSAKPDPANIGMPKWTGWKVVGGTRSILAGKIIGNNGEIISITASLEGGVSLDAAIIMLDRIFVSTPKKPRENFLQAKSIEMLRNDMAKELSSFEKCMAEVRNFQSYIDGHRVQQKEWEGMATKAREEAAKIQEEINALEGKAVPK